MNWRRYGLLFLLNFLATSEFWSLYGAMSDECLGVAGAQRILRGEWPYRHWDSDITPGIYLVGALWFGIVGVSNYSIRILLSLISAFTSVFVQRLADRLLSGRVRYVPWLLWTTSGLMEFSVLNHHWLGSCFVLLGWNCLLDWQQSDSRRHRWAVGACTALALWSIQSEGLAMVLAVMFVGFRFGLKSTGEVVWAGIMCGLLLWLPFLDRIAVVLEQNVVAAAAHAAWNRNPYSLDCLKDFLKHYEGLSLSDGGLILAGAGSHLVFNVFRYVSLPVITLILWIGAERRGRALERVIAYAWLASMLANHSRATIVYVSFQGAGWALVLTLVLSWWSRGRWLAAALASFEGIGWLSRGALRRQIYVHPVATRIGVFYSNNPAQSQAAAMLGEWSQHWLAPGTRLAALPYAVHLYTHYGWTPVGRHLLMPPMHLNGVPVEDYRRAHEQMVRDRVPWLIFVDVDAEGVSGNYRISVDQVRRQWDQARELLTQDYEQIAGNRDLGLYRRVERELK